MTAPKRIQLRRTKGWRKPEGAIVVARPSKWGNPWKVGGWVFVSGVSIAIPVSRGLAVELFRWWAWRMVELNRLDLAPLRGHDLACWCPLDQPCHADILLELANHPEG